SPSPHEYARVNKIPEDPKGNNIILVGKMVDIASLGCVKVSDAPKKQVQSTWEKIVAFFKDLFSIS
ncbi:MAG: hypothetical protein C0412_06820, partial [Flavobacterium sp.]|nr:hypothetical protein [Flavobacterium sp.]